MAFSGAKSIGDLIKNKNIILRGADAATAMGFTQVPNFLLKSKKLLAGDKLAFAMLLSSYRRILVTDGGQAAAV